MWLASFSRTLIRSKKQDKAKLNQLISRYFVTKTPTELLKNPKKPLHLNSHLPTDDKIFNNSSDAFIRHLLNLPNHKIAHFFMTSCVRDSSSP
jgi:hypothetical protein